MKSNLSQSTLAIAVLAAVGRQVLQNAEGAQHAFKITGIDAEKTGSLKDKSKAPYMVITRDDDTSIVVHLHPKNAKNLLDTGTDGEFVLTALSTEAADVGAVEQAADTQAQTAEAGTGEVVANADGSAVEGSTEVAGETTGETTQAAGETTDEPAAPTKKEMAIDAYIEMANAGKTRAEIIKHYVDVIGLTKPGAATYYQNCASNKAGWTEAVAEEAAPEGDVKADSAPEAEGAAAGSTGATDVANVKTEGETEAVAG